MKREMEQVRRGRETITKKEFNEKSNEQLMCVSYVRGCILKGIGINERTNAKKNVHWKLCSQQRMSLNNVVSFENLCTLVVRLSLFFLAIQLHEHKQQPKRNAHTRSLTHCQIARINDQRLYRLTRYDAIIEMLLQTDALCQCLTSNLFGFIIGMPSNHITSQPDQTSVCCFTAALTPCIVFQNPLNFRLIFNVQQCVIDCISSIFRSHAK